MPHRNPYADAPRLPEGADLDPRRILGSGPLPVELEIGCGRGGFIQERLAAEPDCRVLGLEVRLKWAAIVDGRLAKQGLSARGRVFAEDARFALPRLKGASLRAVFVHFPDPWWKKRHQKRRVVTPELLREVVRLLVPGGEFFLQTDVPDRAAAVEALAASEPLLAPYGDPGGEGEAPSARVRENPYGAMSPRERRAVADGLPIVRLRYRRLGPP